MNRIGIDLGGTKIEGVVLDPEGQELFRKRVDTEQAKGYEHILARVQSLYDTLLEHAGENPTLGIGTPGSISKNTGLLKNSNTICLNEKPFQQDLQKKLQRSFAIQNDANCFAMAEALLGAGKGKAVVFGVIMGTGCGGGIVIDGRVLPGLQSIAGEWGHTVLDPAGAKCYCGHYGCVETFISGGGLQRRYQETYKEEKTLEEILQASREQEANAKTLMNQFFKHFGRAMANLINVLDPDIVVLGGGVSNIDELYTDGVAQVKSQIFNDDLATPIVKNKLGDSAGVLGAALVGV